MPDGMKGMLVNIFHSQLSQSVLRLLPLLLIVFATFSIRLPDLSAQTPIAEREKNRDYVRVTVGHRDDNMVYYTLDNPPYPRLLEILDKAIPVYEKLTGTTFFRRIVVVYTGLPNSAVIGRLLDSRTALMTRCRESPDLFPRPAQLSHFHRVTVG